MEQNTGQTDSKTIGLIGGLAFRAGIFYYDQIVQRYTAQGRQLRLVLSHADVSTVLACINSGDKAGLGIYLGTIANELFGAGAQLVAITAVAPHLAIAEFTQVARGPVVSVLASIRSALDAAGIGRVAIFGNRAVMETNVFGTVPDEMAVQLKPALIDAIHATYSDIALRGKRGTQPEMQFLETAAHELIDGDGAQAILLAGTDLSSFYAEQPPNFPVVNLGRLHIDEIVRRAQEDGRLLVSGNA